jgi:hypothetical protein
MLTCSSDPKVLCENKEAEFKTYLIIKRKSSIILPVRKEVFYANTHNDSNVFEGAGRNPGRNP